MNRRFLRTKILEVRARALPTVVFLGVLIVLIANAMATHAQFSSVPVTGFNADIVADGTAGTTPGASTTDYVDAVNSGYVFVSSTFGFGSTVCTATGTALPANNQITSTNTTTGTGITYTLQGYGNGAATNPNALRVPTGGTGSLTLTTPTNASNLYLVCLGGGGTVSFSVTITYADNTSETIVNPVGGAPDWCSGGATYKLSTQQYFRINRISTTCSSDAGACQYLYELPVSVGGANYGKNITSVSFSAVSGGVLNILAMGKKAPCTAAVAPTAMVFGASTTSSVTGSFTASTATGYLVVRYPAGSTPVAPVSGVTYTAGTPIGTGKVVSMGTTTTFTATGLSASTSYDVYVYGYNTGTTCGGPVFGPALIGTQATTACGTPTLGTVTAGVRTITVGATGNTPTLGAALADINTNGMNTPTVIELQANYVSTGETYPIVIPGSPCFSATNTLTIRPATGANGLVIKGTNAGPTIDFNGANYVTLDGRPGGVGTSIATTTSGGLNATNLNIINNNVGGTTIKLDNSAGSNTIEYCDIQGRNTTNASLPTSAAGVVYFDNTGANGNDNNSITYCNIHADSITVFPTLGIFSLGTTIATGYSITSNDNNTVSNCNIYDYFSATTNSVGIELNYNNNAWTITNNSFFEPSAVAITGAFFNRAIWVSPYRVTGTVGNGFTVTNNYIGGSQALCGGTPYTITGSGFFDGIRMEINDGTTPATSLVQGNNIKNISITSSTTSDLFHGIATNGASGLINISNNVIGTISGSGGAVNGGITLSGSASTPVAGHAIFLAGTYTTTLQNNTVANIMIPVPGNIFTGIYNTSGGTLNISNNTIGSLTNAQSISFTDATSVTSTSRYINGMRIAPTVASNYTIANNTIAGIWSNNIYTGSSGQLVGIYVSSSSVANIAMTGNAVRNLYSAANSTGSTTASALIGICASITGAGTNTVTGNTIDSLVSGATANAVNVTGLYYAGSTSVANNVAKNFIHSIIAPATATATITGIYVNAGTTTFANNMIRLGINPDGTDYTKASAINGITSASTSATNNFYYNSVYVGGVGVDAVANNTSAFRKTATSGTYNVLDNIFDNNRSNASAATSGTHFGVYLASNGSVTINNNLYYTPGTGGVFGYNGSANVSGYAPAWVASDLVSVSGNPQFIQPNGSASTVNLHLSTSVATFAESHGVAVTAITTDYDGDSRSGYSGSVAGSAPDIGADEFAGIFISTACAGTPTAGTSTSTAATVCPNTAFTLGLTPVSALQGLTYQWLSSPAGAATWSLLGTSQTTPFYSATTAVATDYRCVVTCTNSGLKDTSVLVSVTMNPFYVCYCLPGTTNSGSSDVATNVTFAGINNSSSTTGGAPDVNGYADYTATTPASVMQNATYPISVTVYAGGNEYVSVWIDYNHNSVFDANEYTYLGFANNAVISNNIAIPVTAIPGTTRMRVRVSYNVEVGSGNPCSAYTYGETEDYLVNIAAQPACAGAPAPGATNASLTSLCAGGTSNLTVANSYSTYSGIKYQWQTSPNGTTWSDIANDTLFSATTPVLTQTANFRLRIICTAGPDTAYSTPALITVNQLPIVAVSPVMGAFCTAGSVTLNATGATTYTWTPSTTLSAATGASVVATPTAITTYLVTGVDGNNCSNTATTTVGPINAFTPVASAPNVCTNNVPLAITVTPITSYGGSTEYEITDTVGTVIATWQASTTFNITPAVTGGYKYYVFARNTGCATSISDTGTITFYVGFGGTVIATNASCANGDGSLVIGNPQGPGSGAAVIPWYVNDFSSATINSTFATLQGAASVTGGTLQITPNQTSSSGGIVIKNPTAINKIDSVNFVLTIPQTTGNGADGISWSYGDITYPTATSFSFESGVGNKLIISFDAYGATPPGQAGIYLSYGQANVDGTGASTLQTTVTSTMLAYSTNMSFTSNSAGKQVAISISSDNKLTLKLGGVTIFNAIQLPAAYGAADKSTWQQIIAARTGGVSEQHVIDNLGIYSSNISYSYGSSPAHSGTIPTTWQSTPVFGGLSGGDSLDLWVANPGTPATCNQKLGTFGVIAPVVTSVVLTSNPSCAGVEDGFVELSVPGALGDLFNVSYNKDGGSTVTQAGLSSTTDDNIHNYVIFALSQGSYANFKVTNATNCVSNTIAGPIVLTAPAVNSVAMASASDVMTQPGAGTQYYTSSDCNLLAAVTSPNNLGTVTANLVVSSTLPSTGSGEPFLGRYVEITPSQNATLPASLKLYFTPADFTAYNASPSVGNASYPAILSDGSNLRIRAFHGLASSGTTGPNGTYNLANSDVIQPASIVFNATGGYWEVTVNSPNGFSGFFANTSTVTPLDINLGDISAVNKGAVNIISWNTKTETAGDRFSLERSKDGRTFTTIASVSAKGYAPSEYAYTDEKPVNGINYYRLILQNVSGSSIVSKIVSATVKNGSGFQLAAYPNPAASELTVNVTAVNGKGTVEILDVTGRTLIYKEVSGVTTVVSLSGLVDGMYIIKYHDDVNEGTMKVNKN